MSSSINFHTEHEPWCEVTSRMMESEASEGCDYTYISVRIPQNDLGMFFSDPAVLDKLADKCREAAEFLRARPQKEVQS